MDTLSLLAEGFGHILTSPSALLGALVGCILGTIVGVLPGLGPSTTIALLIPVALTMQPQTALIMATAIYLGAMYGGTLTSVLLNIPGEPSAVMTALDGHQLARQGRAGAALAIAAIGSFIGGTLSVVALMALAPPLADAALAFGPAEYFGVLVLALVLSATLIGKSVLLGLISIMLGLLLATVGTDLQTGVSRFTFGQSGLLDGIDVIIPIIGVFGVGEVLWSLVHPDEARDKALKITGKVWPGREDRRRAVRPTLRSSVIGFLAGVLPGSGSTMASFLSYSLEKRFSKRPEKFGKGAIEGVAAAETANNASTGGAMIPMLTLGIPGSGATAVLLAYLIMYGIQPGPGFFTQNATLAWALIASLFVSNIVLLILNLPLIPLFVKLVDVPARFLFPAIMVLAIIGGYANSNSLFDAGLVVFFGVVGYVMREARLQPALLVIGIVLGQMLETRFRQALALEDGSVTGVLTTPITLAFLAAAALLVAFDVRRTVRNSRRRVRRKDTDPSETLPVAG
jgi:putative tricarboxylic transport membrane protein